MSLETAPPVAIVGAGLAGLACGLELQRRAIPFQIFEASDAPGGRVRTDSFAGFLLDRGFQVYLTAYPEGQRVLDYPQLRFRSFSPGALVRFDGRFHRVMDPWREPLAALGSLLNPVGSIVDKMRVARLRAASIAGSVESLFARPECTALEALRNYGFSQNMIERFFQPFFGGILLDRELGASSRMLEFVFRMMALGDTVLPEQGMGAIPLSLAAKLPPGALRYQHRVQALEPHAVLLAEGTRIPARAVVVATEGPEAQRLLPALAPFASRSVVNLYFAIPGPAPLSDPMIVLDGNGDGPIHNLCFPSVVSPAYAPPGQHLASVTVLGNPAVADEQLLHSVKDQLAAWFGPETTKWRLLRIYRIRHAHPLLPSAAEQAPRLDSGLFVCGDHRFLPSIHTALLNGRHAAEAVAASLA